MPVIFVVLVCLYALTLLYWVTSAGILLLRCFLNRFAALTQYGGRAVPRREEYGMLGPTTTYCSVVTPVPHEYASVLPAYLQRLLLFGRRWLCSALRSADYPVCILEDSFLGRVRVSRRSSFCAFYVLGIATCLMLLWWTPSVPCEAAAAATVTARLSPHNTTDGTRHTNNGGRSTAGRRPTSINRAVKSPDAVKGSARRGRDVDRGLTRHGHRNYLRADPPLERTLFSHIEDPDVIEEALDLYGMEVDACYAFVAPLASLECLPLLAFLLHCVVRLVECLAVHRFRGGPHDTVTLFSAAAGCSFYLFAAVSSSLILMTWFRQMHVGRAFAQASALGPQDGPTPGSRTAPVKSPLSFLALLEDSSRVAVDIASDRFQLHGVWRMFQQVAHRTPWCLQYMSVWAVFALHIMLQVVQMIHHDALAQLRLRSSLGTSGSVNHNHIITYMQNRLQSHMAIAMRVANAERTMGRSCRYGLHEGGPDFLRKAQSLRASEPVSRFPTSVSSLTQRVAKTPLERRSDSTLPFPPKGTLAVSDLHTSRSIGFDPRVWDYHFPTRFLFSCVLEPHYTCEVLMFGVNGCLITILLLFGGCFPLAATSGSTPLLPYYTPLLNGPSSGVSMWLLVVLGLQLLSAVGVTAFTSGNLAMTAAEHRAFWCYVNEEREAILSMLLPELEAADRQVHALQHKAPDMTESSTVLPPRLRYNAIDLRRLLPRELIPEWNLCPYVV